MPEDRWLRVSETQDDEATLAARAEASYTAAPRAARRYEPQLPCHLIWIVMTTAAQGSAYLSTTATHGSSHALPRSVPEATFRALVIGSALGAVLSAVNLHLGFKIGLGINLSIPAALLAFFSGSLLALPGRRAFSILETNLAQTAASAGAAIAATGLVTAVPALTIVTGYQWSWLSLAAWLSALGVLGVAAAVIVRRQLIEVERLPFALGVATAGLLREIYDRSGNALQRLGLMVGAAIGAGWLHSVSTRVGRLPITTRLGMGRADQFGWFLTIEPMLYAVGALIGLRAALSTLLGSLIAFGWLAPFHIGASSMSNWLVWPGVGLLVVGSLLSLAIGLVSIFRKRTRNAGGPIGSADDRLSLHVPVAVLAVVLVVTLQVLLFGIPLVLAICTAVAAFLLAGVAGRVTGEVAITPSGALAKTAQVGFGLARPDLPVENLIAANVAGGAASQCGELIHDLKCGALIGASWRWQAIAQLCGTTAGAAAGAWLYLSLISNPSAQLLTDDLPAPAVRSLKAVAELLSDPTQAVPLSARTAMVVAGGVAAFLTLLERFGPLALRRWVPSPVAIGFAFLLPPSIPLALAIGAALGALVPRSRGPEAAVCECGAPMQLELPEVCARCGRPTRAQAPRASGLNRFLVILCVGVVIGQTFTELGTEVYRRLH